jgi:hypothetical protein
VFAAKPPHTTRAVGVYVSPRAPHQPQATNFVMPPIRSQVSLKQLQTL